MYAALTFDSIALAVLSALITFFFIKPLTTDGMEVEDREVNAPSEFEDCIIERFSS